MIAIVTVVKDDVDALDDTLRGSVGLSIPFRWIVIDGSVDHSNREQSQRLAQKYSVEYFFEEPRGIYPAMNQGLAQLDNSDHCLFLNGGDRLKDPNLLVEVHQAIESDAEQWFVFGTEFVVRDSSFTRRCETVTYKHLLKGKISICHQSVIAPVGLMRRLGNFDESLKLAADYKLLLQISRDKSPNVKSTVLSTVKLGGVSDLQCQELAAEKRHVRHDVDPNSLSTLTYFREVGRCRAKLLARRLLSLGGRDPDALQRWHHRQG